MTPRLRVVLVLAAAGLAACGEPDGAPQEAILQRSDGPVVFRLDDESRVERRATACGMLSSTLLTLLVVPVFYVGLDRLAEAGRSALRRLLRRAGPSLETS